MDLFGNFQTAKVMADALLDSRKMHEIARLSEHKVLTRRFIEKSASLGLYPDTDPEGSVSNDIFNTLKGE